MTAPKSGIHIIFVLAMLIALPLSISTASDSVEPPGPDETLIYVLREGRFAGWNAKIWIAVNDKTVARVKNKDHAIVRAAAGRITLNLATIGLVQAAIALDDRPGETVYLKWRVGDSEITEVSETEALKFIRKSKRTDPIEEVLSNNEEVDALINLSKLGFGLMRPASGELAPSETSATVTFLRRGDAKKLTFGIWGEHGYVGTLAVKEATTISVTPGEHFFLSGNVGKTLLKLQAEPGKRYYAWLDFGAWVGRVRLTPIALSEADKLESWLADVQWVELIPEAFTGRVREREEMVATIIKIAAERTRTGDADFQLLSDEHGFE